MTIDKITSGIASSFLFQSLRQNLDEYHQGANKIGRIVYQCALARITTSFMSLAMEGVHWLSNSSKNFVQESLVTSLAIPIFLNLGDIFSLPILDAYRREIFVINTHFSTVCYAITHIAIATLCLGTGWTFGIITLAALHTDPILERLGLPPTLSSTLSISNKLIGNLYGLYSGNWIVQGISFFQITRSIERLFLLHIHDKEMQLETFRNLQKLPRCAASQISSSVVVPARYHLIREDIIDIPAPPDKELPTLSEMLIDIDWKNDVRAREELTKRLSRDSAWCDQWGTSVDIQQAIHHIKQGAKNFSEYMAMCPSPTRNRAMWILFHLRDKTRREDRIPYLIEMALHMHYCIAGKKAEIETTYGILFNQIDNTTLAGKIHQIMQYKREDLFKNICREEIEKIYGILAEKVDNFQEEMETYEPNPSDTLADRVQKCLYYIDSYVSHKIWKFRSMIVEKFKEKYMDDVHVYNELKKELTDAIKQQKTPTGFIFTRLIHWLAITIHKWILGPEVMSVRVESLNRICREYNTDFILQQLRDNLQNDEVLHPIDHQHVVDWLQSDLNLEDIGVIYEKDPIQKPSNKIKDSYLIYLLVRIGMLEVSGEFARDYAIG